MAWWLEMPLYALFGAGRTLTSKVIWSFGKGSEIFQENSPLFDFHLKAYCVCIVT